MTEENGDLRNYTVTVFEPIEEGAAEVATSSVTTGPVAENFNSLQGKKKRRSYVVCCADFDNYSLPFYHSKVLSPILSHVKTHTLSKPRPL